MKKIKQFSPIFLIAALILTAGFMGGCAKLSIGPDGYGKTTLPNGIIVLVNQDESTSLTSARILIGGGVLTENSDNNGITNLMIRMLMKGNDAMNASEITEQLDFLGATISMVCYRDYSAISFTSLTENFDSVMEIVSRSLMSPTLPDEELVKVKSEVEGEIKSNLDNQGQASNILFWKTVYGDRGYGLPVLGSMETISKITSNDMRKHYEKYVGGKNIIVSVSTDLPAEKLMAIISSRIGGIKKEGENVTNPVLKPEPEKNGFISFDRNQSYVFTGFVLDHLTPTEVAYIDLLDQTMGGNVGSRLWDLRQKEKLAYEIYSQYITNKYGAIFRAGIGTDTTKVKQALESLDREWKKLMAEGITSDELADAKINMKNSLIFSIDTKGGRANNMAFYECVGYNYRLVPELLALADKVTLDEINNFVKVKLTEDKIYTSIVGKK